MTTRPNIMFFMADQMRADCMEMMGNSVIQTPNLAKIAERGVLFRNAFTPDPICVPARATIMTGNYPQRCTGVKANSGKIKEDQPLVTNVLKNVGYRTYAMGKLHFVPYAPPGQPRLVHGFEHVDLHESGRLINQYDPEGKQRGLEDYYDYLADVGWGGYTRAHGIGNNDVRPCPSPLPEEHYVDHWIADCTIRQIDRHMTESPDQPFFMFMSSPKPHSPYDPPRPYDAMYDPRTIPEPFGSPESLHDRNPSIDHIRYTHGVTSLSPQAWQVIRSYYYGNISYLDAQIGRVMAHLEQKGVLDNTIIVFTADHGDLLGDFGSCFKSNFLNGSVRIPMIIAGPGIASGETSDALVGLQDLLPTLAAQTGAEIGQPVQGLDLSAHLKDISTPVRDVYYGTTGRKGAQSAMIVDERWKYIYSEQNATEELYDQKNDPGELTNLAADPSFARQLSEMRKRLRTAAEQFEDTELLDGDGFVKSDVDREVFKTLPVSGMGWRWY